MALCTFILMSVVNLPHGDPSGITGSIPQAETDKVGNTNDIEVYFASVFATLGQGAILPLPSANFGYSVLTSTSTTYTQPMPKGYRFGGLLWLGSATTTASGGTGTSLASNMVRRIYVVDSRGMTPFLVEGQQGMLAAQVLSESTSAGFQTSHNTSWNDPVMTTSATPYPWYYSARYTGQGTGPFTVVVEFNAASAFTGFTGISAFAGTFSYVMFATDAVGLGVCLEAHVITNAQYTNGASVLAVVVTTAVTGGAPAVISTINVGDYSYSNDQVSALQALYNLGGTSGANTNGNQAKMSTSGPTPSANAGITGGAYAASKDPGAMQINWIGGPVVGVATFRTVGSSTSIFGSALASQS